MSYYTPVSLVMIVDNLRYLFRVALNETVKGRICSCRR